MLPAKNESDARGARETWFRAHRAFDQPVDVERRHSLDDNSVQLVVSQGRLGEHGGHIEGDAVRFGPSARRLIGAVAREQSGAARADSDQHATG